MFKLYKTKFVILLESKGHYFLMPDSSWDELLNRENLYTYLKKLFPKLNAITQDRFEEEEILAPIGQQEVWAAGVTYYKSREARIDESEEAGSFYDKVYYEKRPELFFKANPQRVVGPWQEVYIRRDSNWDVPEPELALFINSRGEIVGYTIGNDMSSRNLEGENPLYLPQAKIYEKSAALGPCLLVTQKAIGSDSLISMHILRNGTTVFRDRISLNRMKRTFAELVEYLYKECDFPQGCYLMTGTGIVPPNDFTLQIGDEIRISIDGIGTLVNFVARKKT